MKRKLLPSMLMLVLLAGLLWPGATPVRGAGFVVNANFDDMDAHDANPGDCFCADTYGWCTLRAAIEEANKCPGADYITFQAAMNIDIAASEGGLPGVTEMVTIDASNVWNAVDDEPGVTINGGGSNNYSGLYLGADLCQIYGLYITGFDGNGIFVDSANNQIGGSGTERRNVLSGNGNGIGLYGNNNVLHNNYLGLTPAGNTKNPNDTGLYIKSSNNIVGGNDAALANFISGNTNDGVVIEYENTDGNWLGGNAIGLAADLSTALGNGRYGIHITEGSSNSGPANTIIGGVSGSGNFIVYNGYGGIYVDFDGGGTKITYNLIGSNTGDGVYLDRSFGCVVGDNLISGNSINGVRVLGPSAGNLIWPNGIWSNGSKGILLQNGGNMGIAAPTITKANQTGAWGTGACPNCIVALYSDADDEGQIHHGTTAADGAGDWTYQGLLYGPNVTATSIDISGNTSEFSAPLHRGYAVFLPITVRNH